MIDCLCSANRTSTIGAYHAVLEHTCILECFKRFQSCNLALALCLSGVGSGVSTGRHDDSLAPLKNVIDVSKRSICNQVYYDLRFEGEDMMDWISLKGAT